jgi:hypothetical protein
VQLYVPPLEIITTPRTFLPESTVDLDAIKRFAVIQHTYKKLILSIYPNSLSKGVLNDTIIESLESGFWQPIQ